MIKPDQFYTSDDQPTEAGRKRMWQAIESEIAPHRATFLSIADKRSFAYGMAAAVLLYLSGVGALTVARQLIENSQPTVVKVDNAYRSAITEFERVVPYVTATTSQSQQMAGELSSRKEQIRLIDAAITEFRLQTNENDISPVKRERLRQLYSMKLQILQQMIERGEIEL